MKQIQQQHCDEKISELLELCQGIVEDNLLGPEDLDRLTDWLADNAPAVKHALLDDFANRINTFCNNHWDCGQDPFAPENCSKLLPVVAGLVGFTGVCDYNDYSASLMLNDPGGAIPIHGTVFCPTGHFASGSRSSWLIPRIRRLGGLIASFPSGKTDYVVVGAMASPSWKFRTFGRKIEKAMDLRAKGYDLLIISEATLLTALDAAEQTQAFHCDREPAG